MASDGALLYVEVLREICAGRVAENPKEEWPSVGLKVKKCTRIEGAFAERGRAVHEKHLQE